MGEVTDSTTFGTEMELIGTEIVIKISLSNLAFAPGFEHNKFTVLPLPFRAVRVCLLPLPIGIIEAC